ncbi:helix-turn-helix domain-containing protein, partial [Nocardiopsis endophytica]|uniref:helix-turn-helix domain-containing protein n=1 Tax=Nocardiopsis endophytica TaxID=3018445 RepID=UPI0038CD4978
MARPGALTPGHRQVLENMWAQGASMAAIARAMGVSPATVGRELDRNGAHHRGARNPRM